MTFGIKFTNSKGEAVISDTTYNTVFIGKGVHYHTYVISASYARQAHAAGGFTSPWLNEYGFKITAPNNAPIIPFFKCAGFANIACIQRDPGVVNGWIIICSAESIPEVFCFSKVAPQTGVSGYGIVVRDAAGEICYSSTLPHLIPYYVEAATTPASNIFLWEYHDNFTLVVPNQAVSTTASSLGRPLTVPLLHFEAGKLALRGYSANYSQYAFQRVAKWTSMGVQVRWGYADAWTTYGNIINQSVPQETIATIGSEGVLF